MDLSVHHGQTVREFNILPIFFFICFQEMAFKLHHKAYCKKLKYIVLRNWKLVQF